MTDALNETERINLAAFPEGSPDRDTTADTQDGHRWFNWIISTLPVPRRGEVNRQYGSRAQPS
jgi:hypothetical protein